MVKITREAGTGRVVLTADGELDDETVGAMIDALALTDDDEPIVIDLATSGALRSSRAIGLMSALAFRSGGVAIRHARACHRSLLSAASLAT